MMQLTLGREAVSHSGTIARGVVRLLFPGIFCRAAWDPIVLTAWLGELPSAATTSCGPDPTPRPRGHFQGRDRDKVTVNTSPFLRALTVT